MKIEDEKKQLTFSVNEINQGEWINKIIEMAIKSAVNNNRLKYYQEKYQGYSKIYIFNKLVTNTSNYTSLIGAICSFGGVATLPLIVADTALSMKMNIQMIIDITNLYLPDLIYHEDPEEMFFLVITSLGMKTSDILKKAGVKHAKDLIIKQALKRQNIAIRGSYFLLNQIGLKTLSKKLLPTFVGKAIPITSMIIGGVMNNLTTRYAAKATLERLKNNYKIAV